jgi:hypothetical protein
MTVLQPLGLAACLPGVLANPAPGLLHAFALICYPSQANWNQGMNGTLRGRVYNQTHGGVYALPRCALDATVAREQSHGARGVLIAQMVPFDREAR